MTSCRCDSAPGRTAPRTVLDQRPGAFIAAPALSTAGDLDRAGLPRARQHAQPGAADRNGDPARVRPAQDVTERGRVAVGLGRRALALRSTPRTVSSDCSPTNSARRANVPGTSGRRTAGRAPTRWPGASTTSESGSATTIPTAKRWLFDTNDPSIVRDPHRRDWRRLTYALIHESQADDTDISPPLPAVLSRTCTGVVPVGNCPP